MTDWHHLTHADGAADDLPTLLARLEPHGADADAAWSAVWDRLYNQGTVYGASFAALPELLALADGWPAKDRVMPLALAGAIAISNDFAPDAERHRQYYAAAMPTLAELADRTLANAELHSDFHGYVNVLQAMLAFQQEAAASRLVGAVADEEIELECPNCSTPLIVALRNGGGTSAVHHFMAEPADQSLPLLAKNPDDLTGVGKRLYERAHDDDQRTVSDHLIFLFGQAICPRCHTTFPIDETVSNQTDPLPER